MDIDTLNRVKALNPEAAAVVKWAIRLEGKLHAIEEAWDAVTRGDVATAQKYVPQAVADSWAASFARFAQAAIRED